jgi:hypothetical protein
MLTSCSSKLLHEILTDDAEENKTRDAKGALTSDQKTRKTSPIHKPTTENNARHNKHWPLEWKRIWCFVCSTKTKETKKQNNSSTQNAISH